MGKLPAIQLQRVQYAEKLVKDGKIVNVDDFIMGIETDNITSLTDEQLNLLKAGDIVIKHTGEQDHAYRVSYKEDGQGICLTYVDASCVETVSYDFVDNSWVYNSTDISIIEDRQAKLTTSSVNDGTLDKAVGFDSQGNLVKGSVSGGISVVEITSSTGVLSDADFAKLGPNCIIKYKHGLTYEYLTLERESGSQINYSSFDYLEKNLGTDELKFYELTISTSNKTFAVTNDITYFLKTSTGAITDGTIIHVIGATDAGYVNKESASHFRIPSGGTTGQVLAKSSDDDYAIGWVNAGGGSGGTQIYRHDIQFGTSIITGKRYFVYTLSPTPATTGNTLTQVLQELDDQHIIAAEEADLQVDSTITLICANASLYSINASNQLVQETASNNLTSDTVTAV